jgi:hypothetical protein
MAGNRSFAQALGLAVQRITSHLNRPHQQGSNLGG